MCFFLFFFFSQLMMHFLGVLRFMMSCKVVIWTNNLFFSMLSRDFSIVHKHMLVIFSTEEVVSIEFPAGDYEQPISIRGPENNASNIPPPPPPEKTVGEKRCDSVPTHSQQGTGVIASTRPVSGRGEKRLRELYGEQAVPLPTQYNGDGDDAIPSTSGCGRKRLREVYGSDRPLPKEGCLSTSVDIDQDYDERGLTLYVESQEEACNNFDSDSSLDEDDTGSLFNEQHLPQLSYSMMNKINRNFKRILNLACLPLSYQEVEEIVRSSQTDVISILQNIIACQQQHTIALSHAADFWMNAHNQLLDENRQLQAMLSEVRGEQQLSVVALSLMSERLNIIQRVLLDLQNIIMGRDR
ncbi:uncharacterized protein LOC125256771 [Megalobrama amblycephala]|uniref:uncharacterized protein LOC125256771 n=1 Tax=Megalobrama amblycephala TaxID=75352 RepID=UPI002013D6DB|nr:uncharacterized protein LOC125256771 [Megalobrama amblycephala]